MEDSSAPGKLENDKIEPSTHQREEMIEQLEKLNVKCAQLQADLQMVLDEKHELELERDAYKCKAHRLNHELAKALGASKPVDLDALINENRYLQDRLEQLLEERELARRSLAKYKGMLESKRAKGVIKLGANSAAGTVMTHKQVEQLLGQGSIPATKSAAALSDLRCLSTALLEALNDKTLALAHQKKTNKILAARICELDSAVQSPTAQLLEGYVGSSADLEKTVSDEEGKGAGSQTAGTGAGTGVGSVTDDCVPEQKQQQQQQQLHLQLQPPCILQKNATSLPKNLDDLVQKALRHLKSAEGT